MLTFILAAAVMSSPDGHTRPDLLHERLSHARVVRQQERSGGADGTSDRPPLPWQFGRVLRVEPDAAVQGDLHRSHAGAETGTTLAPFELQRTRIGVSGAFFRHVAFEVAREMSAREGEGRVQPKSPWKDAYVDLTYFKQAQLQLGRFKVPFGLDALTGTTRNPFAYHTVGAEYLAPGRDTGAMVHGRIYKRRLSYWSGVFRHDGDNATSRSVDGGDRTFATRVTSMPFRGARPAMFSQLQVGAAIAFTAVAADTLDPKGLRGRTALTEDTFFSPVYVEGRRRRWEADIDWSAGPASLRAEYTRVLDERRHQGLGDEDLPDARYRSWYAAGTYLLTGEKARYPVRPRRDFGRGGFGAVQAVIRYERVWFDSVSGGDEALRNPRAETILESGEGTLTLGANWMLNHFVTLQFNAIRERVSDPDRNPTGGDRPIWSQVLRIQFAL